MGKDNFKLVANNKKAYHDYFIDDTYEAGISLAGTEVKSVRMGKCSIKEAFVKVEKNEEVYVYGMHISPYEKGNIFNKDPLRPRKLLLHGSFCFTSTRSGKSPGRRRKRDIRWCPCAST